MGATCCDALSGALAHLRGRSADCVVTQHDHGTGCLEVGAFALPLVPLLVIGLLALLGAVLASIRPGWRAAHLDVLQAIASE